MSAYRLIAVAGLSVPVVAFFGCNSSSNNESGDSGPSTDAAPDATLPEGSGSSSSGGGGAETGVPEGGEGGIAQMVSQTNLFADTSEGGAPGVDPNLVNSWGLAFNPTGIAWVADNGTGKATLYQPNLTTPLPRVVTIPPPTGSPAGTTSTPTGQILNSGATSGDFNGDSFIFSTEDGTVAGWNATNDPFNDAGAATATLEYNNAASGAVYKGLAIVPTTPPILLLANFHAGTVEALDHTYAKIPIDAGTAWTDPSVPAGYGPFNIVVLSGQVYVAYAKQDTMMHDDSPGVGNGAVSVFSTTGTLVQSLIKTGGLLNAPWGLALAPAGWGQLGGMLLVGNFGDGHVNAYSPTTGAWVGSLVTTSGVPLAIGGLWSLAYGVSSPDAGVSPSQLYFTAGPDMEMHGLFGFLAAQ